MRKALNGLVGFSACWAAAFTFAAAPAQPVQADFSAPLLRDWVQPGYPAEAAKAKTEGRVLVEFVVEVDGSVTREKVRKSSDPQFDEAALAAVRQWKFAAGLEEGKEVAMAVEVPVVFELAQLRQKRAPLQPPEHLLPKPLKTKPAHALGGMDPDYPAELEERKLPGEVLIEFTVNEEGRASQPKVLHASHPAFVETALRTLARAGFEPARQGPLPKASKMTFPVAFDSMGAKPADILQANRIEVMGEAPWQLPQILMLIQPVYPRDRLLAAEKGAVTIEFLVNEEGRPGQILVTDATAPEFGEALKAAVEAWVFRPAQSAQGPVAVRLKVGHEFAPEADAVDLRLARLLRPDGAGVAGPTGLDQKLKPLWRGFPVYPQALREQRLAGEAEIEFIIDRDGRSRLPRILKASEEAFGWAAATAISQWVFEKPTKAGEPVDVTVRIPVAFKAPAE